MSGVARGWVAGPTLTFVFQGLQLPSFFSFVYFRSVCGAGVVGHRVIHKNSSHSGFGVPYQVLERGRVGTFGFVPFHRYYKEKKNRLFLWMIFSLVR